ncbi:unnamed protein product [Linum tenue]|uniref:Fe2OG dioxygenase domain-containing protein n=1 Tax=Linum tenue TaxID=586396 RepID=A0AAV0QFR4_9ROSI|nr:unnamed protein product [Linum tenue]
MSCSSSSSETSVPTLRTVTIPYSELKEKDVDLSSKIEEGFGPNGLGILSITDVPGFSLLRRSLLNLSPRLASLPEEMKKELEDPSTRYNFGWSHGKEKLESGKPDILHIVDLIYGQIMLCPNWKLVTFKALGKLILDVGLMVAYHCDQYVSKGMKDNEDGGLVKILSSSRCHKGRLLYYFPAHQYDGSKDVDSMSSWCGWHTDHGSLTGLTCALFKRDGVEIPCPDSAAGLYIRTRTDQIVKVIYGEDELAYQIGETTEILSGGYLCATPHCVRAPKGAAASNVDRSTFALFMQPDWDQKLNFPEEARLHKELKLANSCLTFGEYTEKLLGKYYHSRS